MLKDENMLMVHSGLNTPATVTTDTARNTALREPKISDSNLRLLVEKITVHQNEDKSIDVNLEFNGNFEDKVIE